MVMPVLWRLLHSIFCAALCLLLFPNRATIATLRRACLWPSLSAIFFALKFNLSCWGTSWLRVKCTVSAAFLSATLPAQLSQPASLSPAMPSPFFPSASKFTRSAVGQCSPMNDSTLRSRGKISIDKDKRAMSLLQAFQRLCWCNHHMPSKAALLAPDFLASWHLSTKTAAKGNVNASLVR